MNDFEDQVRRFLALPIPPEPDYELTNELYDEILPQPEAPPLTVGELIARLQELPPDAIVYTEATNAREGGEVVDVDMAGGQATIWWRS